MPNCIKYNKCADKNLMLLLDSDLILTRILFVIKCFETCFFKYK